MNKIITSEVLVAYAQCPHKAFLLLCTDEKETPHEYVRILDQQKHVTQRPSIAALSHCLT